MKFYRLLFYFIAILTIGEVTQLFAPIRQEMVWLSADGMEVPIEQDESREMEDDDDTYFETLSILPAVTFSFLSVIPPLNFDLTEPLHSILVPPPQG